MMSRQTLRPVGAVDTLNTRSMQGGATIVTQFGRDNLEEEGGYGGNEEIDDLRRE